MRKLEDLNFYELLGVEPDVGAAEIESAFRATIQTYGTDSLAVYSVLSEEKREHLLVRIQQAYSVLSDDGRRSSYDKQLRATGNAAQAALESTRDANGDPGGELSGSIWGRVRQVLPAHERMGAKVYRILRGHSAKLVNREIAISSGQYLESVRKMRGMTLEEISEKTKIKVRYLKAFEEEDYESLPAGAYQCYILKALAEEIDLDSEAVVDDFKIRMRR